MSPLPYSLFDAPCLYGQGSGRTPGARKAPGGLFGDGVVKRTQPLPRSRGSVDLRHSPGPGSRRRWAAGKPLPRPRHPPGTPAPPSRHKLHFSHSILKSLFRFPFNHLQLPIGRTARVLLVLWNRRVRGAEARLGECQIVPRRSLRVGSRSPNSTGLRRNGLLGCVFARPRLQEAIARTRNPREGTSDREGVLEKESS